MHQCTRIYNISANNFQYGTTAGTCRITGEQSTGLPFKDWVRDTFTDHASLKPGNIISNQALFCFEEASELIQKKTNREKPQRFRTYSHIIYNNEWYCLTKADKPKIFELLCAGAEIVALTESGQKHIYFKHRLGLWQLDDIFVQPDIPLLKTLHATMCELMKLGFSQGEILSGNYQMQRIAKAGIQNWQQYEEKIKQHRGTQFFDFTGFMLYIDEESKQRIQDSYTKKSPKK